MIEIIKVKSEWDSLLKEVDNYDFYHTYDYHFIAKGEGEEIVLIKYKENDIIVAIPLLIRKIEGTSFFDATSVYGYPGPMTKNVTADFDNTLFQKELQKILLKNNMVSIFSRLNPYIDNQEIVLKGLGEIAIKGRVVNIDLTKNLEKQKQGYQNRLKTYINKSRRTCTIRKARTEKDILLFIDMYYENMRRVNASENYYFRKEYFFDLLNSEDFESEILLAVNNKTGEVIGGAMFMKKNSIVQYHLSGTREQDLHLGPIKLLIDEMRIIGTRENCSFFNLGGGVGNNEDSLFGFKSRFSKDFKPFKVWRCIVNEKAYYNLVQQSQNGNDGASYQKYPAYFPYYRNNP